MTSPVGPGRLGRPPALRGRGMGSGAGLLLVAVGAILVFALPAGSPHWINLHVVGVIMMVWGVAGLALSGAGRAPRDRMRRWVLPGQPQRPGQQRAGLPAGGNAGTGDGPALIREFSSADPPTLADDVLGFEHDPPV